MRKLRGFTLIELLIVVAIIAILAAIAVPNFLEAQVRSKVSRCLADMRSMKTAIESYRVDYPQYPEGRDCNDVTQLGYPEGPAKYRLKLITTPIAYMTSIPTDPFNTELAGTSVEPCDENSFVYLLEKYHNSPQPWTLGSLGNHPASASWVFWESNYIPKWLLMSKGPWREASTYIYAIPYDPTNGTISFGEIVTYGP